MVRKKNKLLIGLLFSLAMNLILIYFIRDKIANKYKQYFCEIPYNPKSRPDYWCIQGWNNTLKKMDINCDVCFFGHSIIYGSDFRKYFPDKSIINLGYPGDNVDGMMLRVPQIGYVHPKKVFLMCGSNSLKMDDKYFYYAYSNLVDSIKNQIPSKELILLNIIPMRDHEKNVIIRRRNKFLEKFARENNIQYVNLYKLYVDNKGNLIDSLTIDGVHLKEFAYGRWADAIKEFM
ncbi:GDSL-type esterase/lipase family protein [Phocaeicola plebeius]|uniref:GDSL-type esterase/lipase family protein n=1 Tax=Phocaeicola plebeius TaxID=310297 RepID=UPI003AB78361